MIVETCQVDAFVFKSCSVGGTDFIDFEYIIGSGEKTFELTTLLDCLYGANKSNYSYILSYANSGTEPPFNFVHDSANDVWSFTIISDDESLIGLVNELILES